MNIFFEDLIFFFGFPSSMSNYVYGVFEQKYLMFLIYFLVRRNFMQLKKKINLVFLLKFKQSKVKIYWKL